MASKGLLRHSSVSTTERHYIKEVPENLYEQEPEGGIENRARFNRHRLAHGFSPDAVTILDALSGCLILDMIVRTAQTKGHLIDRVLRQSL